MSKEIQITCQTQDSLPFDKLTPFQHRLKDRRQKDIMDLSNLILKVGFSFPVFIWQNDGRNWLMDGNGRYLALKDLKDRGYTIPEIPTVFIEAENEREARAKVLELNNQNGEINKNVLLDYINEYQIDASNLHFAGIDFETKIDPILPGHCRCPHCQYTFVP